MANPEITNLDNRTLKMGNNKSRTGVLLSGEVAVEGQVLGFVTASGKLALTKSALITGPEFARVVAEHAVDASGGDKPITYIIEGDLDDSLLVFDGVDDLDTVIAGETDTYREMFRDFGILANTYKNDQIQDNQP